MAVSLNATGSAIREAVSTTDTSDSGPPRDEALTPLEVSAIAAAAKKELAGLSPSDVGEWKGVFRAKMVELAELPRNAGVRVQIDRMLKALDISGLDAAPAGAKWSATGAQKRQVAKAAAVQKVHLQELKPAPSVSGKVEFRDNKAFITTEAGKTLELTQLQGSKNKISKATNGTINDMSWLQAFAGDGPVTVRGTLAADGKRFIVDDYCPGTSSQYTFARVDEKAIEQGKVVLMTAGGPVEVTHPELKEVLLRAPKINVILPGDPKVTPDGTKVYDQNPSSYFALGGRAKDVPDNDPARYNKYVRKAVENGEEKYFFLGDMAYSHFQGKPIYISKDAADRLNWGFEARAWLLGKLKLSDDESTLARFDGQYLGANPQTKTIASLPENEVGIDPDQAASMLSAQGVPQRRGRPDGFTWHNTPAPPPPPANPPPPAPARPLDSPPIGNPPPRDH